MDYTTMMQSVPHMAAAYHTMALSDGQPRPNQMYSFAYSSDPLYLVPHLPHHHDSVDHSQACMQPSKQTEPKPRLAKDEVDLLENEFKKNPKPSSQRKREIADLLKVENPRINNWFQNRRAKAKQMLRREIDTKATGDESSSETPSDQQEDCTVSEYYSSSNHSQPLQASSAAFPTVEQQRQLAFFTPATDASITNSASPSVEEYPSPRSLVFPPVHDLSSYAPTMNGYLTSDGSPCHETMEHEHALHGFDPSTMAAFVPFTNMGMDSVIAPQPVSYHSELMGMDGIHHLSKESVANLSHEAQALQHGVPPPIQQLSSPISSHSPSSAASDLRFKSPPPPANIANRRNKGAPAMLNPTALRNGPYGPKTGIEMGKRIDAPTPIRRISSANGLINRIQKPAMAPVPRSPLYFERNKDVLMQSLQTAAAGPASLVRSTSSNISPVTPRECIASYNHGMLEASSSVSEDEAFSVSGSMQHPFFSMGQTLKTPPGTPGFNGGHVDRQASMDPWGFVPQDEALLTPSLGSYGSEEFAVLSSAPAYALNSQPPTPSFGQQAGHNYFQMQLQGGEGQADFTFPGEPSMPPGFLAKSSPGRPKNKQFQFTQNVTPDDFFSIEK
ncbi:homeobox transcription factor [Grosmannia clavigera kw1407]|uniref:Homeobox transcription factor n=1 Tax=Grosmannia clavigera (strain kw1407 / UAMH 11150) TaxID=655863 RepID=F0XKU9_GROCL|nr:homeobox transcription factor [Grosmannia clavigera kw1407]EFX01593.1 homeobox transcription factor [Grosmannia clavigera kw1407]